MEYRCEHGGERHAMDRRADRRSGGHPVTAASLPVIQSLDQFEAETWALVRPPFVSRYGMLPWADLDRPGAEMEWLVDDMLTCGDKSIIGGPSQSGKSFLAIEIARCIAMGEPFLGHPVRQGLVIYQAGEGARGIKNRFRAYRPKDKGVAATKMRDQIKKAERKAKREEGE